MCDGHPIALVTPSGEMRLKSRGTRRHFRHRLRANLAATLRDWQPGLPAPWAA